MQVGSILYRRARARVFPDARRGSGGVSRSRVLKATAGRRARLGLVLLLALPSSLTTFASTARAETAGRIVFICSGAGGQTAIDVSWGLCSVDGDGHGRVVLVKPATGDNIVDGGELSPDGTKLAYYTGPNANLHLWVANADGSQAVDVGHGADPSWSPDGTRLVFLNSARTPGGLTVIRADGTGAHQISDGGSPRWMPDGTQIVFIVFDQPGGRKAGAYTIPAAGGSPKLLLPGASEAVFSPDGTRVAFSSQTQSGATVINVAKADGSGARQLDKPRSGEVSLSWAPDGASVLVDRYNGNTGLDQQFVALNADGSGERVILSSTPPAQSFSPRWQAPGLSHAQKPAGGASITDLDHDGISDRVEQELAEKYAPVMFMEPGESNYPVSVPWLLRRMDLQYTEDGCTPDRTRDLSLPSPPVVGDQATLVTDPAGKAWSHPQSFAGDATSLCGDSNAVPLSVTAAHPQQGEVDDGIGNEQQWMLHFSDRALGGDTSAAQLGSLNPRDWVTYFHCYPTEQGGVMIQYWHVYAGNVLDRDDHEGDWDASVQVQLDPDQTLRGAWFSRHTDDHPGTFYAAYSLALFDQTHLEYTVDGGGHAAYASPQDWCVNPDTPGNLVHGTIVWPSNIDDPQPASLANQNCPPVFGLREPDASGGGTIWQTWTQGRVTQAGSSSHIVGDHVGATISSPHGGLINVGECNPSGLTAPIPSGACYPLNGNDFVRYSGAWGTTRNSIGSVSVHSPRGPVFQGWHDSAYTSWYNDAASAPRAPSSTSPTPSPTASGTIRRVVFVHGINEPCHFSAGEEKKQEAFIRNLDLGSVESFCYQNDAAYGNGERVCDHASPAPPDLNTTPLYDHRGGGGSSPADNATACDGDGPLAYDATKLEDDLYRDWLKDSRDPALHGKPRATAILANSMGAAVTRGWLRIAQQRRSPTLKMVTTVISLEGAQQGSQIAAAGRGLDTGTGPIAHQLLQKLAEKVNFDFTRPGIQDLAPDSLWYRSVNTDEPVPHLHYYNFYGDITVRPHITAGCIFGHCLVDHVLDSISLGDGVMAVGSPSPNARPTLGGARFMPYPQAADQHEWALSQTFDLTVDDLFSIAEAISAITGSTVMHTNFGTRLKDVSIDSCASGHRRTDVASEINRILASPENACTRS
jgi:hypothetical protein